MGLHQIFWAFRTRYTTQIQRMLRNPGAGLDTHGDSPIQRTFTPLHIYHNLLR